MDNSNVRKFKCKKGVLPHEWSEEFLPTTHGVALLINTKRILFVG